MPDLTIPDGFVLGVSTAAPQIEGAPRADGKGESIWDRFCTRPGAIERGEGLDPSCDHYHRWGEDLDLIAGAGLDAYRFSVAWPRVLPQGTGTGNEAGLGFYDRLVDGCLERGIEPWACLYHWDLPQALEDRGGWPSGDSPKWFEDYAALMGERLGDRVKRWATFNEPSNPAVLGYALGIHAPGRREPEAALKALHALNLAHVRGAEALHDAVPGAQVGTILALNAFVPPTDEEADVQAAAYADLLNHQAFTDPALEGRYPDAVAQMLGLTADDEAIIARAPSQLDWLGVNYYGPFYMGADPETGAPVSKPRPGKETTAIGWETNPDGMTDWLVRLKDHDWQGPVYVTENGYPLEDERVVDGRVRDEARTAYIRDHLAATLAARGQGVDVRGYFAWTLVDNFEWAFGWRPRFGLVHLDRETQERTPKDSYRWYAELARGR